MSDPAIRSHPEQLRADIDKGRTGDKIAGSDPAASPLGTDEEAAGTPPPSDAVSDSRANEIKGLAQRPPEALPNSGLMHYWPWIAIGIVVLIAIIVIL
ncbi:hypothetical protein [Terrihabitans sp. B22-R8]|uniref:hypothetical protein n=1 Tax=Terrihabitans sp. B22-R8 TaxID=3425128 RepID=UPI00403C3FDB